MSRSLSYITQTAQQLFSPTYGSYKEEFYNELVKEAEDRFDRTVCTNFPNNPDGTPYKQIAEVPQQSMSRWFRRGVTDLLPVFRKSTQSLCGRTN